jgi:membrane protease YdiL (CAAX protease family)
MPVPNPLAVVLVLAILGSIVGAWIWVILRLAFGMPVLPPSKPRMVPWGGGSVLATMLIWFAMQVSVPVVYIICQSAIRHQPAGVGAGPNPAIDSKADLKPGELMTLSAISNAATLVLVPLLLSATSRARLRDLGVVAAGLPRQAARGVVAYPLLAPAVFGVMFLAIHLWPREPHPLEKAIAQDKSPGMMIILVLAAAVMAPAAEELIFRGVMLGWLTRLALRGKKPKAYHPMGEGFDELLSVEAFLLPEPAEMEGIEPISPMEGGSPEPIPEPSGVDAIERDLSNPYTAPFAPIPREIEPEAAAEPVPPRPFALLAANVAVSLIFAAMHAPVWPSPIPLFFLSLGLGVLYQRTGGILAPIALHMTFNGVSTMMMFLVAGGGEGAPPGLFF